MSKTNESELVTPNPWQALRRYTDARIALGRAGISQPTAPQLEFQLAHARARDAVHLALDSVALEDKLAQTLALACLRLHSAAPNRQAYLQRPDLGRRLDDASRQLLQTCAFRATDLAIVIADGLSALAIELNALPFLQILMARLAQESWTLAPLCIVQQGRVAVGDEIGQILNARAVVVLIGERPGLSSPDSMGLYLSWNPLPGLRDADRNCLSNVRPAGLNYATAAEKLHYLLTQSRLRQLSGIALKEETLGSALPDMVEHNFLLERD